MAFNVVITPMAQNDIWDAINWYSGQQQNLVERFSHEINSLLVRIIQHPAFYSFYIEDFRRAVVKDFPYLIIFKIADEKVFVYSVIYGGRNPSLINLRIS